MSKLNISARVPNEYDKGRITDILRDIETQVNNLSEGFITANYTALTAAPTTGSWNKGDFIKNSNPSESGSAGSKYIVYGWECTVAGSPGTWLPVRTLTGN